MNKFASMVSTLCLSLVSFIAIGQQDPLLPPPGVIPEPGALALLAVGVAAIVLVRGRNKKK